MPQPIDLSGQRFGRLVALEPIAAVGREKRRWRVRCDCGGESFVTTDKLRRGHTQSCGCIKFETTRTNGEKNRKHGRSHGVRSDPTYRSWTSMRERCSGAYKDKARYFERGIKVCERWASFDAFLLDMGERPAGTTLDRKNNDGHYEPGNCRWATGKEQQRNRGNTTFLIGGEVRRPAAEIAEEIGVSKAAMQYFVTVSRKLRERYGLPFHPEDRKSVDS